jgi:hypothetical protein
MTEQASERGSGGAGKGAGASASDGAGDSPQRRRLTRERVLRGAVVVADAGGVGALTIRSLA